MDIDKIVNSLMELGNTKKEIADKLKEMGCKGVRNSLASCPIAIFLFKQDVYARVFADTIRLWPKEALTIRSPELLRTPKPICDFVYHFDDGDFPELEV